MIKYYDEYLNWQAEEKMDSTAQADIIKDAIKQFPKDIESILCIGIGDGYEMKAISETLGNKLIIGLTLNSSCIKYKDYGNIILGDMHNMPFLDNNYDLIFAKDIFEHSFSHWAVLKEMKRVVKKYILIILPHPNKWSTGKYHTIVPYSNQMKALAKKVDLKLIKYWKYQSDHNKYFNYLFQK